MEEKAQEIEDLKLALKNKEETIDRLKVTCMMKTDNDVEAGAMIDDKSEALTAGNTTLMTSSDGDDAFVKYYKNCYERQKEETAEMEKRWKDEIMEKILVRDENTK